MHRLGYLSGLLVYAVLFVSCGYLVGTFFHWVNPLIYSITTDYCQFAIALCLVGFMCGITLALNETPYKKTAFALISVSFSYGLLGYLYLHGGVINGIAHTGGMFPVSLLTSFILVRLNQLEESNVGKDNLPESS